MLSNTNVIQPSLRSRAWGIFLIVLAWQGPVPVVHAHGTFVSGSLPSIELATHLLEEHSDANISDVTFLDWHWHWMMPDELRTTISESAHPSSSGEQDSTDKLQPIIEVQSVIFDLGQSTSIDEISLDRIVFWQRQTLRRYDLPTSFFMTFGSERSLPERLSVYRC